MLTGLPEAVSRYRDPQLQAGKDCLYLYNLDQNICQSNNLNIHFSFKSSRLKVNPYAAGIAYIRFQAKFKLKHLPRIDQMFCGRCLVNIIITF